MTGFEGVMGRGPEGPICTDFRHTPFRFVEWSDADSEGSNVRAFGCRGRGAHVSVVGAIYNREALKAELTSHGHEIASRADPEIIAHAYEQWAEHCVERLFGMFAVAVWDAARQVLLLARDRYGARLLYYCETSRALAFASDVTRVSRLLDAPCRIDPQAIDAYLTFGAVPAPLSIYSAVRKLPAAHMLTAAVGRLSSVRRYWAFNFAEGRPSSALPDRAGEDLADLLRGVTLEMMHALGSSALLLSGGLDSGILLDVLARTSPRPVRTVAIAFPEKPSDAESSEVLAAAYRADHRVLVVDPDIPNALAEIVGRYAQPYANPSALTIRYMVPPLRGLFDLVLCGEGGDEVFGGRPRHRLAAILASVQGVPGGRAVAGLAAWWARGRSATALEAASLSPPERHLALMSVFSPRAKVELYTPEFARAVNADYTRDLLGRLTPNKAHPLDQTLAVDYGLWIPEVLWNNLDPTQGAAGVNLGTPYLDHRVVEFASRLPPGARANWTVSKVVLRRLGHRRKIRVSRAARQPRAKISLRGLLHGALRPLVEESLTGGRALARGYFRPAALRSLIDDAFAGRADHSLRLWALVMLEQWHRHWFGG